MRGRRRGKFGQFVIMRGEQRLRADLVVQVFDDAPREADKPSNVLVPRPISSRMIRLRARGVVEDVGRLAHLDHERGLPARQIVARADAGEDAVHEINARFRRRNKTSRCAPAA